MDVTFRQSNNIHEEKLNPSKTKKGKTSEDKGKSMLISFFNIKGILCKDFVPAGQTVKSNFYCDSLWWLHKNV